MEKRYVEINRDAVKQKYFEKVIGKVLSRLTGCEASIAGPLATNLGVEFSTQLESIQKGRKTFTRAYMESLMETIDYEVEKYCIEHNGLIRLPENKVHLATEAATEEIFAEDNGDDMGSTLSEMLEEMLDKKINDVKDIAKLVIKMEKDKQDNQKEQLLEENDEIEEENNDGVDSDTEDAFNNGGADDEASEGDNSDEGGNPFGGDDNQGDDSNGFDQGDQGGDSSSGGDSGNPFGDTDSDEGSSNPFGGDDESGAAEGNGGNDSNPFEEQSNSQDNNQGEGKQDQGGSGNPFESIDDISKITIGGTRPFYSLKVGDMSDFVVSQTRLAFEDRMRSVYEEFGQESENFKSLARDLKKTNNAALESVVAVMTICPLLGLTVNTDRVKHWDLFID